MIQVLIIQILNPQAVPFNGFEAVHTENNCCEAGRHRIPKSPARDGGRAGKKRIKIRGSGRHRNPMSPGGKDDGAGKKKKKKTPGGTKAQNQHDIGEI